jgi:hypothetical protein
MDKTIPFPFQGEHTMQLPLTDADTLFEELLQDLPAQIVPLAREFINPKRKYLD